MNNSELLVPAMEQEVVESEKSYVVNKGMPAFVGRTEINRLRKVIDEKNALIEKFKKYDEERKVYYANLQSDYDELKASHDQFSEELLSVLANGDIDEPEYKKFIKLYHHWLSYKQRQEYYRNKLADARSSVRDLLSDIVALEAMSEGVPVDSFSTVDNFVRRMIIMRQHLDTLVSKITIEQ